MFTTRSFLLNSAMDFEFFEEKETKIRINNESNDCIQPVGDVVISQAGVERKRATYDLT